MSAASLVELLRDIDGLVVDADEAKTSAAARDFGGLSQGCVRAVARPSTTEALGALVARARRDGFALTPRGLGLSQSGQSVPIDGVSVEMSGFDGIDCDPDAGVARCGGGVTWRQLLARTVPHGLAPVVMPLNLDLSVGGTLSAGGMGSTTHRFGMAASSVVGLSVITGSGEHLNASPEHRSDVYDAVLGGLGRFGFICAAELRLRRFEPRTRTYFLLYDELGALLADERRLMTQPWCTHLEGFASAAVQGLRGTPDGRRAPFARWFYGLHVSVEFAAGEEPDDRKATEGLGHREVVHVEDADSSTFPARYDLRFQMMRATGAWTQSHPWLECMLPIEVAKDILPEIVASLPLLLGDGHRIMPIADVPRPGLLMLPTPSPCVGFAVLPTGIPAQFETVAIAALRNAHERLVAAGGKRYLSGWLFEPDDDAWRTHYGEHFQTWQARKRDLDPDGILQSRLVSAR